jgi:hypothetical protein
MFFARWSALAAVLDARRCHAVGCCFHKRCHLASSQHNQTGMHIEFIARVVIITRHDVSVLVTDCRQLALCMDTVYSGQFTAL